jgi:hypothetical protein
MIFGKPMKMVEIEVNHFCHGPRRPVGFRLLFATEEDENERGVFGFNHLAKYKCRDAIQAGTVWCMSPIVKVARTRLGTED